MAHDINPQLDVRIFDQGLNAGNLDAFLADGQLYLDGLDFSPSTSAARSSRCANGGGFPPSRSRRSAWEPAC